MRTFLGKIKHSASPKEELVCADTQKCVGRNSLVVENWAASQSLVKLCQIAIIKNLICKLGLTLASFELSSILFGVNKEDYALLVCDSSDLLIIDVYLWRRRLVPNSTWGSVDCTGWLSIDYKGRTGWLAQMEASLVDTYIKSDEFY